MKNKAAPVAAPSRVLAPGRAAASRPTLSAAPRALVQRACSCGGSAGPKGSCEDCERKKLLVQRRASGGAPMPDHAPRSVVDTIGSAGSPLSPDVRSFMEERFGRDFGGVRVHTGPQAERSADAIGARAYTVGQSIAFNRGEYQPHTPRGRHLIAHELAHSVQQAGVQRAGAVPLAGSSEAHLEAEADRAADRVLVGAPVAPILTHVGRPVALRAKGDKPQQPKAEPEEAEPRTWSKVSPKTSDKLASIASEKSGVLETTHGKAQAFRVKKELVLPPEKGGVLKQWDAVAKAGALEVLWGRRDNGSLGLELKQKRDKTDDLRSYWLQKVGWDEAGANARWNELRAQQEKKLKPAKADTGRFRPEASTGICHLDHIVELQTQGTNVASNIQVLDASENVKSGRDLYDQVEGIAKSIDQSEVDPDLQTLILHFDKVTQKTPTKKACAQIEDLAVQGAAKAGVGAIPDGMERYPLRAGASEGVLIVPTLGKNKKGDLKILEGDDPVNANTAQMIPGMLLKTLHRPKSGKHTIGAIFDDRTKSRIPATLDQKKGDPITLDVADPITLDVADDHSLKLHGSHPKIKFHYPYLSEGQITKLDMTPAGISGEGTLTPSIPLLNKLQLGVRFAPDKLEVFSGVDQNKLTLPIPGFKLRKAELALQLHPEFLPSGTIEFEIGSKSRKVVDGTLKVGADKDGFFAKGELSAYLPGVESAKGELTYRKDGWTGGLHVEAKQFKLPVPGMAVKQGTLDIRLLQKGIEAEGILVVSLPREQEAQLKLTYAGDRWLFRGDGTFNIPKLKPFRVWVTYDGENVAAGGSTSLEYRGFIAKVEAKYWNGKISGKGSLEFEKGRVKGKADVELDDAMRLSGKGGVVVRINEDLEALAGIELRKDGGVRLAGALTVTKPIVLFRKYGDSISLFSIDKTFPIPGLSIGPLGVQAKLGASLSADYSIGPAQLVGTTLTLALDPFDDKPDVEIGIKSSLILPATAGLSASITGGLELEAGLARAGGDITVTGGARINGQAGADLDIRYKEKRLEVKGSAGIEAGLVLTLGIKATVYGEVGVWKFKKRWSKTWELYNKTFDTGLKFKLKAPFGYKSGEGAKLPSLNDIEYTKPQLSPGDAVDKLAKSARENEKEG